MRLSLSGKTQRLVTITGFADAAVCVWGGGAEQTLNSALKPIHMCAREEGLNNSVLLRRSGKIVRAGAGRGRVMRLLVCATNG